MTKAAQTIHIEPESELARALKEPGIPVVLESEGVEYRVIRTQDDIWSGYDPERVRAGLRKFAGSISAEEAKRIKEAIYRGREEGTRPIDRP